MTQTAMPEIIRPFFRPNGKAIELTANDFARRGNVATPRLALQILTALIDNGYVRIDKDDGFTAYRLTTKGMDPKTWPTMDRITQRDEAPDLRPQADTAKRPMLSAQDVIALMKASADATRTRLRQLEKALI